MGATSIGGYSLASGRLATALGYSATAGGTAATAVGVQSIAQGALSTALGVGATATGLGSVALGASSVAGQDNVVSVGAAGAERRITNVAAGVDPTDAVNQSQLEALANVTGSLANSAVTYDDASNAVVTLQGTAGTRVTNVAAGELSATSTDAVNGSQLHETNQQVAANHSIIATNAGSIASIQGTAVFYTDAMRTAVVLGDGTAPVTLGNVADGVDPNDAVNKSQLDAVAADTGALADSALTYDDASNAVVTLQGATGTRVTNVAAGELSASSTDAVNGSQLHETNQQVAANHSIIATNAGSIASIQGTAVFYTDAMRTAVVLGNGTTPVTLGNVAAGVNPTDAVNVSQLAALAGAVGSQRLSLSSVYAAIGGGMGLGNGYQVQAPSFSILGDTYNNVGDALGALDDGLGNALTMIDNLQPSGMAATAASAGLTTLGTGTGFARGAGSHAEDVDDTAIGRHAVVNASASTAIGNGVTVSANATKAVAIGDNSTVQATLGTAVGQGTTVQASASGAVALGAGSVATEANTVSVGSTSRQRRIVQVAAGTAPTDAVNVEQMNDVTARAVEQAKKYADSGDQSTLAKANAYTDQQFANVVSTRSLDKFRTELNGQLTHMNRRIDQVGAMGAAMAQMAFSVQGLNTPNRMGMGVSTYHGASAVAVGYSRSVTDHVNVTFGAAHSGDGTQAGVGVGFGW